MKRREFLTLAGGAAATWPLAARAQQPARPVVGILSGGTETTDAFRAAAFRQGLSDTGFVEGRNVAFEFRWADNQYARLTELATELVRSQVTVLATLGPTLSALAAKAATATIPIIFLVGSDPVKVGLVSSMNRPGGNVTGMSVLFNIIVAKQFEMLHEIAPKAASIGFLVNPENSNAGSDTSVAQTAAQVLGRKLLVVQARAGSDLETAFTALTEQRAGALLIAPDPLLHGRIDDIVGMSLRYHLPTLCPWRECTVAGALMSYGASLVDAHRQQGIYAGRILNGEKPANLPVLQPTKFEFSLNLKTARALALTVPLTLQVAADEVIE
jgi:putative tryptophan/tyrosine transport system substrate-binding protein